MATLANGEQLAEKYPTTFYIPAASVRHSLRPGDFAKLLFVGNPGERMWVRVSFLDERGYVGILDNTPLSPALGKRGDVVSFQPKHVIDVARQRAAESLRSAAESYASAATAYKITGWLAIAGTLWWAFQRDRRRR